MNAFRVVVFVGAVSYCAQLSAAEIYGRAWEAQNRRPAVDAVLTIDCEGARPVAAQVDRYGRYSRADLPSKRNCKLSVSYRGKTSRPISVYSGTGSTSANLEIEVLKDRLAVVRR